MIDRVPPRNIEAEQAVLGAMLLEREAIAKVMEKLRAEDFYREAHKVIFNAMLELYNRNEAVDLVTVTEVLKKNGKLEDVGGIAYVTSLANSVPTAANVVYHAGIVEEKSILRQLVRSATEIAELGYEGSEDVSDIIDSAEKKILDISNRKKDTDFVPINNIVMDSFKDLEALMNNKNGLFEYGKALLIGEHIPQNTDSAVKLLEKAVKLKNSNAKRFLALEYISGEHLEQDIEKGIALLTECADSGDVIACYRLGKIYLQGEIMPQNLDKAEKYLLLAEDSEYTQYALAKLYLQEEKYDIQKAVNFFENCAAKNHWASYQLGRIYLFGAKDIERDKEQAIEWFTKSANDGNEYAQAILDDISKFENDLLVNTILSLFVNLSRCIEDDYAQKYKSFKQTADCRLRRMIRQKKLSLGIKDEQAQNYE